MIGNHHVILSDSEGSKATGLSPGPLRSFAIAQDDMEWTFLFPALSILFVKNHYCAHSPLLYQGDLGYRGGVTFAATQLDDAGVATGATNVTRCQLLEHLPDHQFIGQGA